ncbi:MAG: glutamate 5-kinase [Proteobacteria bacterium]|nr:glutamate 5-kinase [Pseudomonadota bacterium]
MRKKITKRARRIVVKIGSSVLVGSEHNKESVDGISSAVVADISRDISLASENGKDIFLVSSGALAMGMKELSIKLRPTSIPEIQAVSAVGQNALMARYKELFATEDRRVAQVLLTHDDLADRKRFLNARNTLLTLLHMKILPVINENDTVAVEEIKFGDNDTLSALVTNLVEADLLIILTDIDGLYDKNPAAHDDAERIALVKDVDHLKPYSFGVETSSFGTGGIVSKIDAASKAAHFGVATIVASGFTEGAITKILAGEDVGTLFLPMEDRLTSKKHWIAFSSRPTGRVFLDEGARLALLDGGKSLLPTGVSRVDGVFDSGEVIHCVDVNGMELARGITNYSSSEIDKIKGKNSSEIETILGFKVYDEVIHRDNLVLL